MIAELAARLLAECQHLRPIADPELDALRRAILVEDVLGARLSESQIRVETLTDPAVLRDLATAEPS